jgi:hypothetical protein
MGYMLLSPQSFVLLLSLLPFAFHIGVPRPVRELFLDALGTGRILMDWNPQCKAKLFDTFAKSQLKAQLDCVWYRIDVRDPLAVCRPADLCC